jgi:serine/threonine protein kinase
MEKEMLLSIVVDIASGCRFLHARHPPVIHGDLKAANIRKFTSLFSLVPFSDDEKLTPIRRLSGGLKVQSQSVGFWTFACKSEIQWNSGDSLMDGPGIAHSQKLQHKGD